MTLRPGPLRAAAALAAGFVVVRVVYRVLFHGADGTGPVLLPLPEVRLPAPFAHVVMFGPVTADGLVDAAASAVPIAATILAFGVLSALVDLPRLIVRASARGPFSGLGRALAIAWATLPALADAARAVRFAQRLRGQRAGVRVLAPLLERTLERAAAVAATLEVRGFAGRGLEGDCVAAVETDGVGIGFGDAAGPVVHLDALTLAPGTLTLVTGATGSGKTTVLRAVAGLHSHVDGGIVDGRLRVVGHDRAAVPPRDLARRVGVVAQHPRSAFATEHVRDEIGLALVLRGVAPVIVAARVAEIAARVGVADLLDRRTARLSAGEATRVAIAAAVIEEPILLLVDEPLADLDAAARARIVALLDALAHEAGVCVVVAEHRADALREVADRRLRVADGRLRPLALDAGGGSTPDGRFQPLALDAGGGSTPDGVHIGGPIGPPAALASENPGGRAGAGSSVPRPSPAPPALRVTDLTVRHGAVVAVAAATVELAAGELVVLTGPNGAGKSSLLTAFALDRRVAGSLALVPDASDDLFVYDTVGAECARADRRARAGAATTAARFGGFLGLSPDSLALAARLARHPRDLSVGERRLLALSIQLAGDPGVLLVDEPTRGLDPAARDDVLAALTALTRRGVAVLVASHEPEVAAGADRVLRMERGVLRACKTPEIPAAIGAAPTPIGARQPDLPEFRTPRVAAPPPPAPPPPARPPGTPPRAARTTVTALAALAAANLVALAAFAWPLVATAVPDQAEAAVPVAALALLPLAALVVVATLDGRVRSAHLLALLGTLAAIGAAVRIASTGVGGVEALFILLILAGRAFGARFGMLLGMASIALSTLVTGTFGPWTPFQMFACAWVGAGAGLLPRRVRGGAEIAMLSVYGVVASYAFGLVMNLWFWPFAVGYGTGISYDGDAPLGVNLASFLLYSLVTSSLSWDTLRAITTIIGMLVVGRAVLAALRRAKPLQPATRSGPPAPARGRPRSDRVSA
ncbi:ATP-binding cassette domain-containing protein [Microbacterium hominis]|uniref:ATP-binding cassette domain-containing protein n=1 Tax=Microbacterium hominis TaxID=162426 RepID=A0A7D4Q6W0_9MICO|nr:ATP-binding cassette domain-containing protein [Microbacterium hominis]QKJ18539.1 ATP-binding cassette domain-containing protein [Microbacterium hominis]